MFKPCASSYRRLPRLTTAAIPLLALIALTAQPARAAALEPARPPAVIGASGASGASGATGASGARGASPATGTPPVGQIVLPPQVRQFALQSSASTGTTPPPEIEITAGDTFQDLRTVTCDAGPSNAVLSLTVNPPLAGTISPSSGRTPQNVTITVPTTNKTPEGIYTIAVDIKPADSSSLCQETVVAIAFKLDAPAALAVVPPSQSLVIGQSVSYAVDIFTKNFSGKVHLAAAPLPPGVSASFSPNDTTAAQSTLTLTAAPTATAQTAVFDVTGTANVMVDPASAAVILVPPSVAIQAKPATQTVMAGAAATFNLRYTPMGVSGPITLVAIDNAPPGAVPTPGLGANQPASIQLQIDPNTVPSTYSLTFVFQFQANGKTVQTSSNVVDLQVKWSCPGLVDAS